MNPASVQTHLRVEFHSSLSSNSLTVLSISYPSRLPDYLDLFSIIDENASFSDLKPDP